MSMMTPEEILQTIKCCTNKPVADCMNCPRYWLECDHALIEEWIEFLKPIYSKSEMEKENV